MVVVVERLRDMVLVVPRKAKVARAANRASANTGLPQLARRSIRSRNLNEKWHFFISFLW